MINYATKYAPKVKKVAAKKVKPTRKKK